MRLWSMRPAPSTPALAPFRTLPPVGRGLHLQGATGTPHPTRPGPVNPGILTGSMRVPGSESAAGASATVPRPARSIARSMSGSREGSSRSRRPPLDAVRALWSPLGRYAVPYSDPIRSWFRLRSQVFWQRLGERGLDPDELEGKVTETSCHNQRCPHAMITAPRPTRQVAPRPTHEVVRRQQARLIGTAAARSSANAVLTASSTPRSCRCSRRRSPRALAVFR
jgi:hypothetical protein